MTTPPEDQFAQERERLRSKGATQPCPACNRQEWGFVHTPTGRYVLPELGVQGEPDARAGVKLMVIVCGPRCRNCGFIRLHSADVLLLEGQQDATG
jgi:hypothetical protein